MNKFILLITIFIMLTGNPFVKATDVINENHAKDENKKNESGKNDLINDDNDLINLNLRPIYFHYNSSKIQLRFIPELYNIINYMRKSKSCRLKIIGHSDYTGEYYRNVQISMKRARSVRNYFVSFGLSKKRFIVKGYGSRYPAAYKFNELNRRVEFEIIK